MPILAPIALLTVPGRRDPSSMWFHPSIFEFFLLPIRGLVGLGRVLRGGLVKAMDTVKVMK